MEFSPTNPIVRLCLQAMAQEAAADLASAATIFTQAWNDASDDFEKFLSAFFLARHQVSLDDCLRWYDKALEHAQRVDDVAARSAVVSVHLYIARCYEEMGDRESAQHHRELAERSRERIGETGPFFHGTKADLRIGDLLVAGKRSNYQTELVMNHIYFTALPNGAGLAAALAAGEGQQRVYLVEPSGAYEDDPNVTDKKFPGNLTRSYRTEAPLKIVGELHDWSRQSEESIQQWRERLAQNKGEIIN